MFAFPEIDYDNHPFYQRYNNTLAGILCEIRSAQIIEYVL